MSGILPPTSRAVLVTGAASGIGAALVDAFTARGDRVVAADLDEPGLQAVAARTGAHPHRVDLTDGEAIGMMVQHAVTRLGGLDVVCSNAGVPVPGGLDAPASNWELAWKLHVMANVDVARSLLRHQDLRARPVDLVITASANGMLLAMNSAPYTATKRAVVGLAEYLSVAHHDDGLRVKVLCPRSVDTPLLAAAMAELPSAMQGFTPSGEVLTPARVADDVLASLDTEAFFIFPHADVLPAWEHRVTDHAAWLEQTRTATITSRDSTS